MALITLDEALDHLRLMEGSPDVGDVMVKAEEASDIVLDYVTVAEKGQWTDETAPWIVRAAVKLVLTALFDDRMGDPLTPGAKSILRRLRDPALA